MTQALARATPRWGAPDGVVETGDPRGALAALFAREGYARVEPPILQPAEPFLDLSGEDLRRRMFVTSDAQGRELCLRPEYTIPVCRHHLRHVGPPPSAPGPAGAAAPASYAYLGPVFRLRAEEPSEFVQAGIESIGREDAPAADAEILALALEGIEALGIEAPGTDAPGTEAFGDDVRGEGGGAAGDGGRPRVRLGDMGLLDALLDALQVAPAAKRRALRAVAAGRGLAAPPGTARTAGAEGAHAGLLAAIEGQDPQAARAFVEDVLAIAGIDRVGGRSAGEIAERFLAKAATRGAAAGAGAGAGLGGEALGVLERYLALALDPDAALVAVRALAAEAGLATPGLAAALDLLEARTGFMAARGLPVERFTFVGGFARNLDYYTGFIFEVLAPRAPRGGTEGEARPLVGGGRYDGLLRHLGAPAPVPAVGCAFWLERIEALGPSPGGTGAGGRR